MRPERALLLALVFIGGFSSLGIEFAASRLLAPYFGQALFVWGLLIGMILIYLTVGYAVGGRLADRHPNPLLLYTISAAAAAATGLIPFVSRPILGWAQTGGPAFALTTPAAGSLASLHLPSIQSLPFAHSSAVLQAAPIGRASRQRPRTQAPSQIGCFSCGLV